MRVCILTRNAIHGGVETIVALHSRLLNAPVIVTGGHRDPYGTCPFAYEWVGGEEALLGRVERVRPEVLLCHWLPEWAAAVVTELRIPVVEYVHRNDTLTGKPLKPQVVVAHAKYLVNLGAQYYGCKGVLLPPPVDADRFRPQLGVKREVVGSVTSYEQIKGLDFVLRAWARLQKKYPHLGLRFYGAGTMKENLETLAASLGAEAEFRPATREPEKVLSEFRLFLVASRNEGGLPLAAWEALACGVPVVAPDLPGCLEVNERAAALGYPSPVALFRSEDVDDLAAKVDSVLSEGGMAGSDLRRIVLTLAPLTGHMECLASVLSDMSRKENRSICWFNGR